MLYKLAISKQHHFANFVNYKFTNNAEESDKISSQSSDSSNCKTDAPEHFCGNIDEEEE